MSQTSSDSSTKRPFNVNLTYPVPNELYKAITGIIPQETDTTDGLGTETETIRLILNDEDDAYEYFYYMFQDIFHDSQGARSGEGKRLSDFFNPPTTGKDSNSRGLNNFIESFLYGMNQLYGNKFPEKRSARAVMEGGAKGIKRGFDERTPPQFAQRSKRTAVGESWEKTTTQEMINRYYATNNDNRKNKVYNIKGTKESEGLENILRDIKKVYYRVGQEDIPAFYTKYSTEDVLNAARPYLVSYDAGSDLLHSILGLFGYVDISIVNVKDPGDSLRKRNKLLTSIEKIVHQRPAVGIERLLVNLKKNIQEAFPSAQETPRKTNMLQFLDGVKGLGEGDSPKLDTETYYVHNYITTRILECLREDCKMKHYESKNIISPTRSSQLTSETIFKDYKHYIHHKFKAIVGKEQFIIHKKNIRFIIEHKGMRFLDVEYYFDENKQMKIKFHLDPNQNDDLNKLESSLYDRFDLNSARDVGFNIDYYNEQINSKLKIHGNPPAMYILNTIQAASVPQEKSILEFLNTSTQYQNRIPHFKAISKVIYLECMYKFIGDFCQVLYSYYLGSIFASFDRSAVSMAILVMKILMKNKDTYKIFKSGSDSASETHSKKITERMGRGLILVTSTTFHHKTVPKVTYYTDYNGALNIERGKASPLAPIKERTNVYFNIMKSEIELFDANFKPPGESSLVETMTRIPRRKPIGTLAPEYNVVRRVVPVREEKKRVFQNIEEEEMSILRTSVIPKIHCILSKEELYATYTINKTEYNIYKTKGLPLNQYLKNILNQPEFVDMKLRKAFVYAHLEKDFSDHRKNIEKFIQNMPPPPRKLGVGKSKISAPKMTLPMEPWICIPKKAIAKALCPESVTLPNV